jgi:hypothetical protein
MTQSFWQRALQRLFAARSRRRRRAHPAGASRCRLALEILEDRTVPSTLTVTNLLDSGAGSLRDQIAAAASGDTIAFDSSLNGTINLTSGELGLTGNLTIQGPGAATVTVNGGNAQRVFHVEPGANVTISGLTIANGHATDNGGGIETEGSLTLLNSTLANNSSGSAGGGLYFVVSNTGSASLTVSGSTFMNNSAGAGGGLFSRVDNGSGQVSLSITNTNFSGNTAREFGGGLDSMATLSGTAGVSLTVSGGTFSGNSATLQGGGAIASTLSTTDISQGTVTLTGSLVQNNRAGNGAGVSSDVTSSGTSQAMVTFSDTLESNAASQLGGGLFSLLTSNDNGRATLAYSGSTAARVDNNTARDGGGVYSQVTTNGAGSAAATFTNNQNSFNIASESGGGVYSLVNNAGSGTASATVGFGNIFANEAVSTQGGGIFSSVNVTGSGSANMTVNNLSLTDNMAGSNGGGLFASVTNAGSGSLFASASTTVTSSFLSDNTAGNGGGGGAFLTVSAQDTGAASATVSAVTASGNTTTGSGGGIAATVSSSGLGPASVTIGSTTSRGNSAGFFGGGVFARLTGGDAGAVALTVNTSTLSGNNASQGGGLFASVNTNGPSPRASAATTLNGSTISGNRAGSGAGLFFDLASSGLGGAAQAAVNTSTIDGNSATGDGGGVSVREQDTAATATTLTLTNSTVYANRGANGGGVANASPSLAGSASGVTLLTDTVAFNNATSSGGGLDTSGGPLTVRSSIVAANTAGSGADAAGTFLSGGHNVVGQTTGSSGWVATDLTGTAASPLDARFGAFGNTGGPTNTLALLGDTPAFRNGDPAGPTTDQRGAIRSRTTPTSGAVELVQATSLQVSPSVTSVRSGTAFSVIVSALDSSGSVVTTFVGAVHFTSSDPNAILPADYTFAVADFGHHTFTAGVTLQTDGTQTITAASAGVTGSASVVAFSQPGSFRVTPAFTTVASGSAFSVAVSALDGAGNVLPGYDGTIQFTSSDAAATLPVDYTFTPADAGSHTFQGVTLQTQGDQTLSVTGDGVTSTVTVTVTDVLGTWTSLTHTAPVLISTMMLLTDGTVLAEGLSGSGAFENWFKLTPDSTGSYVNGTWSPVASMHLQRLYFGSNVLPDGRVFLVGGEFTGPSLTSTDTNTGEIYDPVANTWTQIADFPQPHFGDDPTALLPDGRILAGFISGPQTYIYDPATNTWSFAANKLLNDRSDEETWVTLPDGSVLSYDVFHDGHAQRYLPDQNQWVDAGDVPVTLSGRSQELGGAFRLPDGRVLFLGATGHTALYDLSTNTWTAGPDIPAGLVTDDAPGAMMPNGHVLFSADHTGLQGPTTLFEYDPVANTMTPVLNAPSVFGAAFGTRMLVLPSGQVLFTQGGTQLFVYTPHGDVDPASKPTVSSVTDNGDGTFTLVGTQLNGISEGASYGDDAEMSTNYPIVQLVDSAGNVFYARTFNWSPAVATGDSPVSTDFTLPAGLPGGTYSLFVIANGIASDPFEFTV